MTGGRLRFVSSACSVYTEGSRTPWVNALPLHDALPIFAHGAGACGRRRRHHRTRRLSGGEGRVVGHAATIATRQPASSMIDRKTTRLNCSNVAISYAFFCMQDQKRHDRIPQILIKLHKG